MRILLPAFITVISLTGAAAQSSLEFIRNEGQWTDPFLYKASYKGCDIYLEKNGFTYLLGDANNGKLMHDYKHNEIKNPPVLKFHAYKIIFEGANPLSPVKDAKAQQGYYNYFLGNDPSRWKTNIHPVLNVDYQNIYPGIDAHISSEKSRLKYDFIVYPGSDPEQIKLRYEGADDLSVKKGNLEIKTSVGTIVELAPVAYQYVDDRRVNVACRYALKGNTISYFFPKGYDDTKTLIIDPTVVFARFSGSTADNWGFTATYDQQGNFYAGGVAGGPGYPTVIGSFSTTYGGGGTGGGNVGMPSDIVVTKYNPSGTLAIYATYIGGNDNDQPHSMVVDNNGNLIIAGRTYSSNYPTQNPFQSSLAGNADIVVTKLNAAGTALIGSTYMGGSGDDGVNISSLWGTITDLKHNYGDDARSEVITDNSGNVYVAASTNSADFPTVNAFQGTLQGQQDGVVFKLNGTLNNLIWSTYLGGSGNDAAYVLALNVAQSHLYVSGGTVSSNFPTTPGTFHTAYQGGTADGYIVKFQNSGSYNLVKGTFIGTSNYDQCYGVQTDASDGVYAMGQTLGGTFPVTGGVYSNPGSSQFVIKLDSNLTNNVFSTVFGSGNSFNCDISPVAFLIDTCEQIYISGWGGPLSGNGGNTVGMPVTPNAAQSTTDGSDFYFIVLEQNAAGLLYGTFYGGSTLGEHVDGGTSRFDKNGVVYQGICGGCGGSSAFPVTDGSTNNSTNCNYVALKIAFQLATVSAHAEASPDSSGCAPFTVQFVNSSANGTNYLWDFGDGSPTSTAINPVHTFTDPGLYHVTLIVQNPNACNVTVDTAQLTIFVDTNTIKSGFDHQVLDSCGPFRASFTNTSQFGVDPNAASFQWFFGDGTTFNGANPPIHNYPDTGIYVVMLVMDDPTACNSPDTTTKTIVMQSLMVKAAFNSPDSACLNEGFLFGNASSNAATLLWDFGDGNTSNASSPIYTYTAPGVYTVTLIVTNPNSCNKADTATKTIKIKSLPTADFTHSPKIPIPNEPIQFTNQSINAVSYSWGFGDGTGSSDVNPTHLYKKTGSYTVCLEARSADGCLDTICKLVDAEVYPVIDVPTGFSPNGDGVNDILIVRGAAVESMQFRVFNRWGELVFEVKDGQPNDPKYGWDGKYKGKEQEMEAYAWVLDATFIDGSTAHRTGNVTLLR